ncbi:hypothetical protein [Kingella potus]|nr:hypothetical protein [Kingella potus]UOP00043.1 hypothetical protein LVJ84_08545 [Kingella potus]
MQQHGNLCRVCRPKAAHVPPDFQTASCFPTRRPRARLRHTPCTNPK